MCYCKDFALFYFEFEGNSRVQAPRGLYLEGRFIGRFLALRPPLPLSTPTTQTTNRANITFIGYRTDAAVESSRKQKSWNYTESIICLLLVQDVAWRTDFLIQHYGEGEVKIPGCPELSSGVYVSLFYRNLSDLSYSVLITWSKLPRSSDWVFREV